MLGYMYVYYCRTYEKAVSGGGIQVIRQASGGEPTGRDFGPRYSTSGLRFRKRLGRVRATRSLCSGLQGVWVAGGSGRCPTWY